MHFNIKIMTTFRVSPDIDYMRFHEKPANTHLPRLQQGRRKRSTKYINAVVPFTMNDSNDPESEAFKLSSNGRE